MTEEPAADDVTQHVGAIRGLLAGVVEAARTRLDLVTVEAEIFVFRTIRTLLWAFAAVACGLLALAFVIIALVAALWDTHRMLGVLAGAALFVVLTGVFGFMARRTFWARPHALEGTLAQLESDQSRLEGMP